MSIAKAWMDLSTSTVDVHLFTPGEQKPLCTMSRKADEPLSACCKRLALNVQKSTQKKGAKPDAAFSAVLVTADGQSVPDETLNSDAWQDGTLLRVSSGGVDFGTWTVVRDEPMVLELSVPELPMANFQAFAIADVKFATAAIFEWSKVAAEGESAIVLHREEVAVTSTDTCTSCMSCYVAPTNDVGCTLRVVVTPKRGASGTSAATYTGPSMQASCAHSVFAVDPSVFASMEARTALLPEAPACGLRVVSYNVLWGLSVQSSLRKGGWSVALLNSGGDASSGSGAPPVRENPVHTLVRRAKLPVPLEAAAYRQHVLGKELVGYAADVLCLQEVTEPVFQTALVPILTRHGMAAEYGARPPASGTQELATFWREAKLQRLGSAVWHIGQLLEETAGASLRVLLTADGPSLYQFVLGQPHVAHVLLLRHRASGRHVAVVNCHLIMSNIAAAVRSIQAHLVLSAISAWLEGWQLDSPCSMVLSGDLNTYHEEEGALQVLAGRSVSASSYQWPMGRNLGKRERRCAPEARCIAVINRYGDTCTHEALAGDTLCWDHRCAQCGRVKREFQPWWCVACIEAAGGDSRPSMPPPPPPPDGPFFARALMCPCADGLKNAYEEATGARTAMKLDFRPTTGEPIPNGWADCRDHIFCSADLRVTAALAPPEAESMRGMPNLTWPSDHMALVADLEWPAEAARDKEATTIALPAPKRVKSDPGRSPTVAPLPRPQRSWGETSLRGALPEGS